MMAKTLKANNKYVEEQILVLDALQAVMSCVEERVMIR